MNRSILTSLALAALGSPLLAQSLDGTVVRNPDDTVTYTIDLDGPPRGTAFVFLGALNPFPIPTPFGPLHLDPLGMLTLSTVQINAMGQGTSQFTLPSSVTNGLTFSLQSLNLDLNFNLALSQNYLSLSQGTRNSIFGPIRYSHLYRSAQNQGAVLKYEIEAAPGTEARLELKDDGQQPIVGTTTQIGPTGTTGPQSQPAPPLVFPAALWSLDMRNQGIPIWQRMAEGHYR